MDPRPPGTRPPWLLPLIGVGLLILIAATVAWVSLPGIGEPSSTASVTEETSAPAVEASPLPRSRGRTDRRPDRPGLRSQPGLGLDEQDGFEESDGGSRADPAAAASIDRDVTYCTNDGVPLKLDVYHPAPAAPSPLVIFFHGGGWSSGDKHTSGGLAYLDELLARGYTVASVNYRLSPEFAFPAHIIDAKCAVRYLRANAAQYNVDPDRFAAMGYSAGGHLAMLLGVTDESAGFDVGEYAGVSSAVSAVITFSGVPDWTSPEMQELHPDIVADTFESSQALLEEASPIDYVDSGDPPFLMFHGTRDLTVPIELAEAFDAALTAAGVTHELVVIPDGRHRLPSDTAQGVTPPTPYVEDMLAFLDAALA